MQLFICSPETVFQKLTPSEHLRLSGVRFKMIMLKSILILFFGFWLLASADAQPMPEQTQTVSQSPPVTRTLDFIVNYQAVGGANAYRITVWSYGSFTNVYDNRTRTSLQSSLTYSLGSKIYCLVEAWMPETWEWLQYPVCQWPQPQPVLDYLLLTGPVGVPVAMLPNLEYRLPIGTLTQDGIKVVPSTAGFFILNPTVASKSVIGPTQPLQITKVYKTQN